MPSKPLPPTSSGKSHLPPHLLNRSSSPLPESSPQETAAVTWEAIGRTWVEVEQRQMSRRMASLVQQWNSLAYTIQICNFKTRKCKKVPFGIRLTSHRLDASCKQAAFSAIAAAFAWKGWKQRWHTWWANESVTQYHLQTSKERSKQHLPPRGTHAIYWIIPATKCM